MLLNCLLLVFLHTNHLANAFDLDAANADPMVEWNLMENFTFANDDSESVEFIPRSKGDSTRPLLKLPASVRISAQQLHKELFIPGRGGIPVPPQVREMLLPKITKPAFSGVTGRRKPIELLCHLDRIYVRVLKSLFSSHSAHKHLRLGTCPVNKQTRTHYYFLYNLKRCGLKRGEDENRITYSNTLRFRPVVTGVIVRELPFTVPVRCSYAKFHRSYQTGFLPIITGGTFFRSLQRQGAETTLSVMDDSWNLLGVEPSFELGKPVCFEANGPNMDASQRLYLNRCFVSSSPNFQATEKYSVIENYGCLMDSMNSALTKFYTTDNNLTVRFCIGAFLFKTRVPKTNSKMPLYMHCEMDIGPETPTPETKSCTYDAKSKTWTELYGDSSVCDCCESTCSADPEPSDKTMISSKSWDMKIKKEVSLPEESIPEFVLPCHDDTESFWESQDS
ncbi:zona pellucida sperm-binding protein 3 [Danio aesculapii]|uniref:zona pellucida sperm-binding protein 3 n=1 Tax=Danio aesculapii TaxID=1142201 RepID=UPI0024C008E7|nr:zona pellucida sperm-binding protein 3 [Danio aesculapii]